MRVPPFLRVSWFPVVVASLCCLSPIILVLLGLSTVSFAASLSNTLYGEYRWAFRAAGAVALTASLIGYLRRAKGICTIAAARKRRNEVINTVLSITIVAVVGYVIWLYVVLEAIGKWLQIWR